MPKKFQGGNTKAVEARERKADTKRTNEEKKKKEVEDRYWEDDDKHVQAKEKRKQEQEEKRKAAQQRKAEAKALAEKEEQELAKFGSGKDKKITRLEVQQNKEKAKKEAAKQIAPPKKEDELEENINHVLREERMKHGDNLIEARTVDEAVSALSSTDGGADKHPEKRMKAAFLAYEEIHLPILKQENPGLKFSQLKDLLWKQWQKAPENPLNQTLVA